MLSTATDIKEHLGYFVNPKNFREKLDIRDGDPQSLIAQLEKMLLIRAVEEEIASLVLNNEVKCPCHLGVGQEAVAVGVAEHLNSKDRAFGNHRSHNHYLAMGGSVDSLFAEIFGKKTGCSKGIGGSMHIYAGEVGFHGAVPIVAGTVPVAVGAALSAKLSGSDAVGVAFFGDGACEEGVVHECLNIASVMKLPMIFIVENNLYSSHMDICLRQTSESTARFAVAHEMEFRVVDGNDVISVEKAASELISHARSGGGPGFLEAITYRWLGHVGGNADIDVGVRRSTDELESWKKRDPISRLFNALESSDIYSKEQFEMAKKRVDEIVKSAVEKAKAAPWPEPEDLHKYVYQSKDSS